MTPRIPKLESRIALSADLICEKRETSRVGVWTGFCGRCPPLAIVERPLEKKRRDSTTFPSLTTLMV
jgi:hypothetical protein